jgi:hypothetical protein
VFACNFEDLFKKKQQCCSKIVVLSLECSTIDFLPYTFKKKQIYHKITNILFEKKTDRGQIERARGERNGCPTIAAQGFDAEAL